MKPEWVIFHFSFQILKIPKLPNETKKTVTVPGGLFLIVVGGDIEIDKVIEYGLQLHHGFKLPRSMHYKKGGSMINVPKMIIWVFHAFFFTCF